MATELVGCPALMPQVPARPRKRKNESRCACVQLCSHEVNAQLEHCVKKLGKNNSHALEFQRNVVPRVSTFSTGMRVCSRCGGTQ